MINNITLPYTSLFLTGTDEERGMAHWKKMRELQDDSARTRHLEARLHAVYDLPIGMEYIRKFSFLRYIPVCPTFGSRESAESQPEECDIILEVPSQDNKFDVSDV